MNHDILQMYAQLFSLSLSHYCSTIFLLLFITTFSTSQSEDHEMFSECRNQTYNCGQNIKGIGYPYWGDGRPQYCGHPLFQLKCQNNDYPVIDIDDHTFRVLGINSSGYTMTMARLDLWYNHCPQTLTNITLNTTFFGYPSTVRNLYLFYNCTSNFTIDFVSRNNFTCDFDGSSESNGFYADESFLRIQLNGNDGTSCEDGIEVSVLKTSLDGLWNGSVNLQKALNLGFEVIYNTDDFQCAACETSGGTCGFNLATREFVCFCHDQPHRRTCQDRGNKLTMRLKLIIGVVSGGIGMLLMSIIICYTRSKTYSYRSIIFWRKQINDNRNFEAFIRNYGSLSPKRYSYSEVKKMTNAFKDKLGQGGYGCVYQGKLVDNRLVAVKLLDASKGNGEDFINEVASIGRTSHVNIVTFLGFCLERSKRALIYEFMSNGSLEKFIYGEGLSKINGHLGWEKLYQISIGIARGLEYLHRGCSQQILHFDIKPHNILLDEDFCPKISDFGLAKLCTKKESIISTLEARGTIGYIAPEVFSRNFGRVSHKSDVYSYGMMTLEMVGGRKNVDIGESHTSQIYFPHWVYKRLELDEELGFQGDMTEEENEMARKMIFVGLWCIQTDPSQRPSISRVLEMLEGSIEALEIPPKPYLYSPSRSAAESSTT
ncbi:LEAF RUST 10 DISEASE-RESISTANCE LOCUS RECEPTOR-LIKE PROTEIN KINASE-like 2.1 isoform X1 [Cornus florida]|uniref:LEAF RUST 10 DISEASE-RESISTANCE LOCUS RECEPTOR-LIKE PROTEIN KINASE-like 2.1 isoform X1 n=1 Tax=Cornus florida TaxID=4283 RepID=UPI0028A29DDC|nr:LEAF RUST 10 DISEASE-RESISTANCE LOCUS RECEPTOR-LIKE PROTEIN KINASE-like 2.1 isoform X1 [Cornus florida]